MSEGAPPTSRRVALFGRANSGKTSLLMHLTGSMQRPVNFPGTSVEAMESSTLVGDVTLQVVDLPGVSSMQPQSKDEQVTIAHVRDASDRPDLVCFVLDAAKLAVELQLLQQLRTIGLPVVVAVTKADVARAEGFPIPKAAGPCRQRASRRPRRPTRSRRRRRGGAGGRTSTTTSSTGRRA